MKVIITMAGLGDRFRQEGYTMEKYEIVFCGRSLFEWAISSLLNFSECDFIFIARKKPGLRKFIVEKCGLLGIDRVQIKMIDNPTKGQAETALLAGEFIKTDDSISIFNIDTHVCAAHLRPELIRGNGWIPVFSASGDHWSFAELSGDGTIARTREKVRISDYCSIGFYYFDSFMEFKRLSEDECDTHSGEGECYIAPLYNRLIGEGKRVYPCIIPSECVLVLGTPKDLIEADSRINRAFG